MKTNNKNKKSSKKMNYRIFRVIEPNTKENTSSLPKKITMVRIYAKDNDDAYLQLKEYVKVANKQFKYYVEAWSPYTLIRNGKKYEYEDYIDALSHDRKNKAWYKRAWDDICLSCWVYFVRIPKDIYYWFRDLIYIIRYKQQYHASWTIDKVMLETLKFNIPILKKYKNCLSWKMLEKAYLEKHPELKPQDAKKYFETHFHGFEEGLEKRAIELEHEMFDNLIDDINAYEYYMGGYEEIGWWADADKEDMKKTDKKLRKTLPLIKGSYDNYEYKKINTLAEKHWNRIWETMRIYGQEFND